MLGRFSKNRGNYVRNQVFEAYVNIQNLQGNTYKYMIA